MTVAVDAALDRLSSIAVLLIEDDDVDRERTRRMIAKMAPVVSVFEVFTGQAAIAALTDRRFDVILLDYQLPDCTATELLPLLHDISGSRCPVIILTGHGDEDLAVWALQHGADDYLAKHQLTASRLCDAIESSVVRWRTGDQPDADAALLGTTNDEVMFRATLEGTFTWISHSVRSVLGWNRTEVIGSQIADRGHPDDPPLPMEPDPEPRRWLHRYRHRDGRWYWMETTHRAVVDAATGLGEIRGVSRDVTARIEAEHELAENESRYRRLVNLTGEAVLACNADGVITFVNAALAKLVDRSSKDLVGAPFEDLVHPKDLASFLDRKRVRANSRGDVYELRLKNAMGRKVWAVVNSAAIYELGRVTGSVALLTDVSARREAEKNLAVLERRHRTLLEMSPVGMFRSSSRGELLFVNRKWCEIAGRPWERDATPTWKSVMHPDDFAVASNRLRRGFEAGEDLEEDFRLLTPLGEVRWVTVRSVPVSVTDERRMGRIGMMEDVSERRAEQEALRRSEELYRSVIESMTEGVYIQDARGHLIESNVAARRLLAVRSGDLRDVTVVQEDGTPLPPNQFPAAVALRTGSPSTEMILGVQNPVRGRRWLSSSAQPLRRDDDPHPWAAVCTLIDVTDRREVDRMKSEFIAVVSHEMRTPLTSIKGALGLVSGGATGSLSDTAQRMIEIAANNTDRLIRLVNDMLDLERIESGRITLVRRDVDLADLLRDAVAIMRPVAEREGVQIISEDADVDAPRVLVDGDRIIQTVTNLLSNAVKFSPAGSCVRIRVDRHHDSDGREVVSVRVIDRGRGVPPEGANDIFVRFHQVDASDSRDKGGTGLGLAICKSIVDEHGGRIWMETTPGGGATCVFTLSLSRPVTQPAGAK
ncbi:MAG TPA: PAS domain S-box protein [Acidimicrobiales bacterium]|nr:PAS domain S-box protein [Acidimicrobiales bacterium]